MRFRKKPVVIDASRWYKSGDLGILQGPQLDPRCGWCETLEGGHVVSPGDWIITGVKGERYPCKADIFDLTYENAEAFESPQPAQADEWKQRLIDKLVVSFIYCSEHDTNPEKAMNDLLDWEVKAALDPLVSAEARALIEQGKAQADEALALLRRLVKAWDEWVSGGVPQFAEAIVVARAYLEQHK